MKRVLIEEWSFTKTSIYDEHGELLEESDGEAWPVRKISEEEITDEECNQEYAV